MNYLNGKSCYLAGAMQVCPDNGIGWRKVVITQLEQFGLTIYDPTNKVHHAASEIGENKELFKKLILQEKWQELKEAFEPVMRYDLRCVDKSDFLIMAYNGNQSTVGTIHEAVAGQAAKKPILLKYDRSQLNAFNPWISVLVKPEHLFARWEDMFDYLKVVNSGTIDKHMWTL